MTPAREALIEALAEMILRFAQTAAISTRIRSQAANSGHAAEASSESGTVVRLLPGKGNCLIATSAVPKGHAVVKEQPLFVSKPTDDPRLFAKIKVRAVPSGFFFSLVTFYSLDFSFSTLSSVWDVVASPL
jgi:hypothetical protein